LPDEPGHEGVRGADLEGDVAAEAGGDEGLGRWAAVSLLRMGRHTRTGDSGTLALLSLQAEVFAMATIMVRNLDEDVKRQLRMRAARHGRSMEAEVRAILEESVRRQDSFAETLMGTFGELGGVELELPARTAQPRSLDFDDE
jgi:plasmid stability protein